jgi:hypothetical protein
MSAAVNTNKSHLARGAVSTAAAPLALGAASRPIAAGTHQTKGKRSYRMVFRGIASKSSGTTLVSNEQEAD